MGGGALRMEAGAAGLIITQTWAGRGLERWSPAEAGGLIGKEAPSSQVLAGVVEQVFILHAQILRAQDVGGGIGRDPISERCKARGRQSRQSPLEFVANCCSGALGQTSFRQQSQPVTRSRKQRRDSGSRRLRGVVEHARVAARLGQ